jgi:hypothetical protein
MKKLLALLAIVAVTGCAGITDSYTYKKQALGYKHYDPCIRCGEQWTQFPNWENEAVIRRARGETW